MCACFSIFLYIFLRHNWHITFHFTCIYNTIYICIVKWSPQWVQLSSIITHNYYFVFSCDKTFKIYSLSSFQIYNTGLLTIVTKLCITSPGLILWLELSIFWPSSCISPTSQPLPQATTQHTFLNQPIIKLQTLFGRNPALEYIAFALKWILLNSFILESNGTLMHVSNSKCTTKTKRRIKPMIKKKKNVWVSNCVFICVVPERIRGGLQRCVQFNKIQSIKYKWRKRSQRNGTEKESQW